MQRYSDWPERLAEFLKGCRHVPFVWGLHDCSLFACAAVEAITGIDLAAEARGRYDSEASAKTFLASVTGGGGLEEYAGQVAAEHRLQEVPLALAKRGDVVLYRQVQAGSTLGIIGPNGVHAVFASPSGIVPVRVANCHRAWRIG